MCLGRFRQVRAHTAWEFQKNVSLIQVLCTEQKSEAITIVFAKEVTMRYAIRAIQNNLCTENTSIKVKEEQNGSGCDELSVEENINDIIIYIYIYI